MLIMIIKRDSYLRRLIDARGNGMAKAITGIRRCGKSFLLRYLFIGWLKEHGVDDNHIIYAYLDSVDSDYLRSAQALNAYIKGHIKDKQTYYIILDEIQLVEGFERLVNGLLGLYPNVDIYMTGSNSKFLSSDIITEFRGRSWEIRIYPLSFSEYYSAIGGDAINALGKYVRYGGLPMVVNQANDEERIHYVREQATNVYLNDIVERNGIANDHALRTLAKVVASNIGSLTSSIKIADTFTSNKQSVSVPTINKYLTYLEQAFVIENCTRYDIKGRKHIGASSKYYFTDMGIRNSLIDFNQIEMTHIMENIIYIELMRRGYLVNVGVVSSRKVDGSRTNLEVDFVARQGDDRIYIQSAYSLPSLEKVAQEKRSLLEINDEFRKVIITMDMGGVGRSIDEHGIITVGLIDFLLNPSSLNYLS